MPNCPNCILNWHYIRPFRKLFIKISLTMTTQPVIKQSKVEALKQKSDFLRGPIDQELTDGNPYFSPDGTQILKFHGSYQQKDRDFEARKAKGEEPQYSMMLRTRSPGGLIPWQLYQALDRLADTYGNHTLRATTRQGFQIHGILKENLKTVIADIVAHMGSTVGACGDINRNVMAPPAPFYDKPAYGYAREYAIKIADLLAPQAGAYYDLWLDGEQAVSVSEAPEVVAARQQQGTGKSKTTFEDSPEPIYGTQYMPRKFKVAIAVPGDNSVDLFTNDLGLVVITDEADQLLGFNVYVGGGLGRTHNNDATIVRLADGIGFVPKDEIYEVVKAIVAVQRDYGDRFNRRHARFKYILNDWGVEKFKETLLEYYPTPLAALVPLPEFTYQDYLGWHEQGDGNYFVGVSIVNGRVYDNGSLQLKTALKEITDTYHLDMVLTANQNLLLTHITPEQKPAIQDILARYGIIPAEKVDPLVRYSMACPAFPTCTLAVAESERALPNVMARLRTLLDNLGLGDEQFITRMTGCPNGCARPYMAELGFVGSNADEYQVWLGGSFNSTRLAEPYVQKLHINDLETGLTPLFVYFRDARTESETFGDFCARKGIADLREFAANYVPEVPQETAKPKSGKRQDARHRVTLSSAVYERLRLASEAQNKPMKDLVEAALAQYLES